MDANSNSIKLIDTHTHLSSPDFDEDREEVLKRAFEVCNILIDIGAGTSADAGERARQLAEENQNVYFTSGIHPHDAATLGQHASVRQNVEKLLTHPKCVAVGEAGLDYYYENSPKEEQRDVFKWQIELAQKHQMPLMIHTREAEDDTQHMLEDYQGSAVFHCFTGTAKLRDFGVDKSFLISFSGIVTFKKATELQEVFLSTPLENILLETDSPYLAPTPMRGKRNESSFIRHTADFLSKLRDVPYEELARKSTTNSLKLFTKIKLDQ